MNSSSNGACSLALTGVGLIAFTLLCGTAQDGAGDSMHGSVSPQARLNADALPGFDLARTEVTERQESLHVQLHPGPARMGLIVVDGETAGRRPVLVSDRADVEWARMYPVSPPPPRRTAHLE